MRVDSEEEEEDGDEGGWEGETGKSHGSSSPSVLSSRVPTSDL